MPRLQEVTEADCGVWIAGSTVNNPVEFSVAIIDLAISEGMGFENEVWEQDKPVLLRGDADLEMLEEVAFATDYALQYLNEQLPEWFYFDFQDGLVLFYEEEFE